MYKLPPAMRKGGRAEKKKEHRKVGCVGSKKLDKTM